jgi:ABC-2 type transport system ATP-binding protein
MSIELRGVTKIYGSQKAVDNISINLKAGEICAFLGPNGAGKTTTMKMITGLIPAQSGDILVMGQNIKDNPIEIRKHIGYLPENNPLYTDMYISEYLNYVAKIYMPKKEVKESVRNAMNLTGLNKEDGKKISQLSKGFKQRVGLAQALIHNPDVLILDEPTTGLDPNQIVEIRELIKMVGKDKCVMLSTHIMQEVEAICDRVIIIKDGKIVADDTASRIVHSSKSIKIGVQFSLEINEDELSKLEGVISIEKQEDKRFIINCNKDIREDIFLFAVAQKNILIELQLLQENLEAVFKELTQ